MNDSDNDSEHADRFDWMKWVLHMASAIVLAGLVWFKLKPSDSANSTPIQTPETVTPRVSMESIRTTATPHVSMDEVHRLFFEKYEIRDDILKWVTTDRSPTRPSSARYIPRSFDMDRTQIEARRRDCRRSM